MAYGNFPFFRPLASAPSRRAQAASRIKMLELQGAGFPAGNFFQILIEVIVVRSQKKKANPPGIFLQQISVYIHGFSFSFPTIALAPHHYCALPF